MPSFAMGKELAGLGGLFNRFVTAPLTGAALFNQGRSGSALNQGLQSIPSTRKTDAGRALGNVLGNEMRYMGSQLQRGSLPYLGNEMRYATNELSQGRNPYGKPLNAIQTGKYGPTDWNPNANPLASVSSGGAADRAYQQELSRTAQLTAQDPELQRYEAARSAAKTQEEMNAVRDMGMEMWQQKYGQTPMGQPGGAIGSTNPLMRNTFGYQTGMSPSDIAQTITNPAAVPVGPGEATYQTGDLGTRALADTGYDPAAFGVTPEQIEAIKKQLLVQAGAK